MIGATRRSEEVSPEGLRRRVADLLAEGRRLALVAAHDDGDALRVVYLFTSGAPDERVELTLRLDPGHPTVPSLSGLSFSASRFEREMRDSYGVEPEGHPFLRPLVRHQHWPEGWYPMRRGADRMPAPPTETTSYPFVEVRGTGVYEIPVGPVHAGLIEPGHFRFSVVGETILKMTARLWYVHRGVERMFHGEEPAAGIAIAERISGDSAVAHSLAFCLAVEEAQGLDVSPEARNLRSLLVEMERLVHHVEDVGALCNDVSFAVAHARAMVVREKLLRLNEALTGHRLLRGALGVGSTRVRTLPSEATMREIADAFEDVVSLAVSHSVVVDRFEGTATLARSDAAALGTVGPVARASGLEFDARRDHPLVAGHFTPVTQSAGDVLARFTQRVEEFRASIDLVISRVRDATRTESPPPSPRDARGSGVGLVEGWRGVVAHRVELDRDGRLTRVRVVDPSFFNWPALAVALTDTIVPDFPLTNKSFNLSYAGNDL